MCCTHLASRRPCDEVCDYCVFTKKGSCWIFKTFFHPDVMCICDSSSVDREQQQRWWCCSSSARSSLIFLHDGILHDPFCLFTKFPHIQPSPPTFGSFSRRVPARVALFLSGVVKKSCWGLLFRELDVSSKEESFSISQSIDDSRRMCNSNGEGNKNSIYLTRQI